MTYVAPKSTLPAFTCPHCGAFAQITRWGYGADEPSRPLYEHAIEQAPIRIGRCSHCGENCIWWEDLLVYPDRGSAPQANPDMPAEIREDYEEAARIYHKSPRGAAALLRLAIQKLMIHLGLPGKNINDDIGALVKRGLPPQIQQALDVLRVTGNNAVHPGQLDANDTAVAEQLFPLLNVIVESQISVPARIQEMYNALPQGALAGIAKRDGTTS